MDYSFLDSRIAIKTKLDQMVADEFMRYVLKDTKLIDSLNVGPILKTLGCVPSITDINEFILDTEIDRNYSKIHLSRFMSHLKMLLLKNKMRPLSMDGLIAKFHVLDKKKCGYIHLSEFKNLMKNYGEPLSEDEMDVMLKASIDPITQCIHYITYVRKLACDDSIYEMVKQKA
jgi:Ca2+-binding EF-hand superfamily protein